MSAARDHFVYRIFDTDGRLLYVGCSKQPSQRWKEHCNNRPGFRLVKARFRVQGPYIRIVARQIEKAALDTESPLLGQASRSPEGHTEHLYAERQFTSLPHLDAPVMCWHRFEARPLVGFPGYWRVFSEGKPTTVISAEQMRDEWRLAS